MNLKLIWTDLNTVAVTLNIYRSDTPIDTANLPAPVGTITDGSTNWVDTTAERGKYYYYVFETTSTNDRVVSTNYRIQAVPRFGPGPSELKYGDYNYGYFGTVTSSDFINTANLRNAVGFQSGTVTTAAPVWHKYVRNGIIYFVPHTCLAHSVQWTHIYTAGIMFGITGNGPHQNGAVGTNQRKTVQIGADTYIVRSMKGYSDDVTRIVPSATVNDPTEYSNEWNDFILPLCKFVPNGQRLVNVSSQGVQDTLPGPWNGYTGAAIQEQSDNASLRIVRRGSAAETRTGIAQRSCNNDAYLCSWYPILELVAPAI